MFEDDFKPICVGDLINPNNKYTFVVPSFQRGYRWDDKQVLDLLEDLDKFVNVGGSNQGSVYYLQPLIVCEKSKANNEWYLLDGQQRLTTMRLVLLNLKKYAQLFVAQSIDEGLYEIEYESRAQIDFNNPDKDVDINNYYIHFANECIKKWISDYKNTNSNWRHFLPKIIDALSNATVGGQDSQYDTSGMKFVKFIWFDISDSSNNDVAKEIEIYNRFNSNKIKLTPSELIKALFVLEAKKSGVDISNLLNDWNSIEKQFQNDKFWHLFGEGDIQTRIDYLFNTVAKNYSNEEKDKDKAYREYQEKYDKGETLKNDWDESKRVFNLFVQCYEDPVLYNYFGLLVFLKEKPGDIIDIINDSSKDYEERLNVLKNIIRTKIISRKKEAVDFNEISQLSYDDNKDKASIKKVLLLHNIETCNSVKIKFDFDRFYADKWEIEHVDAQNGENFTSKEQIKEWLGYVKPAFELFPPTQERESLVARCDSLLHNIENETFRIDQTFREFANDVNLFFAEKDANGVPVPFTQDEKQKLWNLALLDKTTNIAFSNSPFPSKRQILISSRLENGDFVPICTERLFLKYYPFITKEGSHNLDFLHWTREDREHYINDINEKISDYLKKVD